MNPKVSIVIPVYNTEIFLPHCLNSCIEQTYKNIEIIVVNDCSPGNCGEILREYQSRDKRIVYLPLEENSHVFAARQRGTLIASGEYITYLDSDDWLSPDVLEHAVSLLNKYPDGVFFNYLNVDDDGVAKPYYFNYLGEEFIRSPDQPQDEYAASILFQTRHEQGARLLKKEICVKTYQDLNVDHTLFYGEDLLFMAAYLFYAQRCGSISDGGYYYRQHPQSMMNSVSLKQQKIKLDNITAIDRYLRHFWQAKGYGYKAFAQGMELQKTKLRHTLSPIRRLVKKPMKKILTLFRKIIGTEQLINEISGFHRIIDRQQKALEMQQKALRIQQKELELHLYYQNRASFRTLLSASLQGSGPAVFYLGTPEHGNLGDQAIAAASLNLLQSLYPDCPLVEFTYNDWLKIKSFVIQSIRPEDIIFLPGGGNMGNLWVNEEELRRSIIGQFPNNRIISMPQSVSFSEDPEGRSQLKLSQDIYNTHPNLTIMGRDELSFSRIKEYFPGAKHVLAPDAALFWEESFLEKYRGGKRDGVLFVLRSDKEKNVASSRPIQKIQNHCLDIGISHAFIDTVVPRDVDVLRRNEELSPLFQKFAESRLVITDRYYGLIFSVLTSTPCIVYKSLDHKISEGVKWFSHLDWVHYAPEEEAVSGLIQHYTQGNPSISHPLRFTQGILDIYRNMQ